MVMSSKSHIRHCEHKVARAQRFDAKVYGEVQQPVLPKNVIGVWDPPGYRAAAFTARHRATTLNDGIDRKLDMRCFYTGIPCWSGPVHPPPNWDMDARKLPFLGTRDHLIPARRHVSNRPQRGQIHNPPIVWSSNIANVTLGLAPLAVRLKIRSWLMTAPYDRTDVSVAAGNNLRWLIISYMDHFRIQGRYPWSRNRDAGWWMPEIQEPFMQRMYRMEDQFQALDGDERETWINHLDWRF
jgi:hypothetical protein